MWDNEDALCGIKYNDMSYYFLKNLQGDVIAITDAYGAVVARYSYDAWGVPTIVSDTSAVGIATVNPFRYRGYYYDAEIGLYYLQSRYYNPVVGRFVNADVPEIIDVVGSVANCNVFAYCQNKPINYVDPTGFLIISSLVVSFLFGLTVGFALGAYLFNDFAYSKAKRNYHHNIKYEPIGYVYGQDTFPTSEMIFGYYGMGYNGCELIAIYNAAKLLNKSLLLSDIVYDFEYGFNAFWGGVFGSNPHDIGNYLHRKGFNVSKTRNIYDLSKWAKAGDVFIMSYWTSDSSICSLHTVAVQYNGPRDLEVYNYSNKHTKTEIKSSFLSIVSGKSFICGYRVS